MHAIEHDVAAVGRRLLVTRRRIIARRFRQAGQQRAFFERAILQRLGEVILRASLESISAAAQKNLVAVHLHDLLFGVIAFDLQRQQNLFDLARVSFFRRQKQRSRQLLCQRRSAFGLAAFDEVLEGRADDANRINADVLKEAVVFYRPDGVLHVIGNLLVSDGDAAFERELADHGLAIIGKHAGDEVRAISRQRRHLLRLVGHAGLIGDRRAEHYAGDDR